MSIRKLSSWTVFLVGLTVSMAFAESSRVLDPGIAAYKSGDWTTAMSELKPLAENGNAVAQLYVGFLYQTGKGLPIDLDQAIHWYTEAANQDNARAQFNLATAYESGRGVEKDLAAAHRWYLASAELDFERAQYKVAELYLAGTGIFEPDLVQAHKWFSICGLDRYLDARKRRRRLAKLMDPYDIAEADLQKRLWLAARR